MISWKTVNCTALSLGGKSFERIIFVRIQIPYRIVVVKAPLKIMRFTSIIAEIIAP